MSSLRNMYLRAAEKIPLLRKARVLEWKKKARRFAQVTRGLAPDERAVFFESFGGRSCSCSPWAIFEQMCSEARFDGWTFYWSLTAEALDKVPPLVRERARLVLHESDEYFRALASSKYWVQNNRVPEYLRPADDQVYVQCWHGTPLKRLGCDVSKDSTGGALNSAEELAERFRMDAEKWTYLLSPSDYASEHLCDAFGLPRERRASVVLQEGYPRNDAIRRTLDAPDASTQLADLRRRVSAWLVARGAGEGLPAGKKVLLYAPTFREDQYTPGVGYSLRLGLDLDALRMALGGEWVVLLRMHYYIANQIDLSAWRGFAFDVSAWPDINGLYLVSDALCTDYSSVFFDFSNTGRPLYFLWPDLEHYGKELHGFYLDPRGLPGPKCADTAELVEALQRNDSWLDDYGAEYERFRGRFCPKDDGHASARVIARVFS